MKGMLHRHKSECTSSKYDVQYVMIICKAVISDQVSFEVVLSSRRLVAHTSSIFLSL